uniref:Uncharacterized protein AlNc14C8G1071 n=1 Tax=Albugo laibachii Nc14 TaxID=890382 RepID=F0W1Z2_9STRA|nr:conserved hypothetical protein [Albugo laibachii Nc14]|eukprot:CCA15071.1 conserved hypothetical protein [Albugo laibachii Nc14]
MQAIPILNAREQERIFGISCGDNVSFEAGCWAPGGEFFKTIALKNISRRTIRFKYELPATKHFSMDFPSFITLTPGMDTKVTLVFRPVQYEHHEDVITFSVKIIEGGLIITTGKFRIPITAHIDKISIELPTKVDLGFCPVAEVTEKTLTMRNAGQIDVNFTWTVPSLALQASPSFSPDEEDTSGRKNLFVISPSQGRIAAGKSITLKVLFSPTCASGYVASASCSTKPEKHTGSGSQRTNLAFMEISAVSKFPYLEASITTINFKEILLHSRLAGTPTDENEIVLRNPTLVSASFRIKNVQGDQDQIFFFNPVAGVVAPRSTLTVRVKYMPLSSGTFTCDYFDVVTPGSQHQTRLTCKGSVIGPRVSLWTRNASSNLIPTSSINFRDVPVGSKVSRVLVLRNESAVDAYYHIDCQAHGIFQFETISGKIAAHTDISITVILTAKPAYVGNFYRRIFVLLQHQSSLFLDMLATSFDEKLRPSPFEQAHIDAYRWRAKNGLGCSSPQQLDTIWKDEGEDFFLSSAKALGRLYLDENIESNSSNVAGNILARYRRQQLEKELMNPSGEATLAEVGVCNEYFENAESQSNPITLSVSQNQFSVPFLDFGSRTIPSAPNKKILHIRNNTQAKVVCMWHVSMAAFQRDDPGNSETIQSFQIHPVTAEIEAGLEVAFQVAFQPQQQNSYYFAELEAYVSFSSNRSFRLVNVQTFTPPWCISLKVCGNTFVSADSHYISQLVFHGPRSGAHATAPQKLPNSSFSMSSANHRVHFPPCYLSDSVFQTIMIENTGDTPALFQFSDDPTGCYECRPNCGYISSKSIHLVQIRFSPVQLGTNRGFVHCIVNYYESTRINIELIGVGAIPKLTFNDHPDDFESSLIDVVSSKVEAKVYLKPTALGLSSVRCLQLINVSRIPLVYGFDIPDIADNVFSVKPDIGRIDGRETVDVNVYFSPQAELRKYMNRLVVKVKPISFTWKAWNQFTTKKELAQAPISRRTLPIIQESGVRVISEASYGAVMFEPTALTFDTVLTKSSIKKTFDIVNAADCDLAYELVQTGELTTSIRHLDSDISGGSRPFSLKLDKVQGDLTLSHTNGLIPLRSRKRIIAKFSPRRSGLYNFDISCIVSGQLPISNPMSPSNISQPHSTGSCCKLSANASFPTILIHNISAMDTPKSILWRQFNCDAFNSHMSSHDIFESDMSESEGINQTEIIQYPSVDFCFTPAPKGSAPQVIFIQLYNPGSLVTQYELLLPGEGNVEMEHWADTAIPSGGEMETLSIVENRIFDFIPKKATLLPQESKMLRLTCNYTSAAYNGSYSLPLLLQIDKGKKMVLQLHGHTITSKQPKLWVSREEFRLFSTMIGEYKKPPKFHRRRNEEVNKEKYTINLDTATQRIQVFNVGGTNLKLEVDINSLKSPDSINSALRCTTTAGDILPGSFVYVNIHFSPRKPQMIEADLILRAYESYGTKGSMTKRPSGLMRRDISDAKNFAAADLHRNACYNEACTIKLFAEAFHPMKEPCHYIIAEEVKLNPGLGSTHAGYTFDLSKREDTEQIEGRFVPNDNLDFGHIPSHSRSSRVLILRNESETRSMHFEWDKTNDCVTRGWLKFSPMSGGVAKNGICLIRVSIEVTGDWIRMDEDVACFLSRIGSVDESNDPIKVHQGGQKTQPAGIKKKHQSVISRSTASQEAIKDTRVESVVDNIQLPDEAYKERKKEANKATIWPLYAHIIAHPLPLCLQERFLHKKKAFVPLHPEVEIPANPPVMVEMPSEEITSARMVLQDVMEMLLADVFQTRAIQKSIDQLCRPDILSSSESRSMRKADGIHQKVPQDICERSCMFNTCSTLLENTFHNVLQEIAHDFSSNDQKLPSKQCS